VVSTSSTVGSTNEVVPRQPPPEVVVLVGFETGLAALLNRQGQHR